MNFTLIDLGNLLAVCMVRQHELQMIIYVRLVFVSHSQSIAVLELKFHRVGIDNSRRDWEIIDYQMNEILMLYTFSNFL